MTDDRYEMQRPAYVDEDLVPFDPRESSSKRAMWMLLGLFIVAVTQSAPTRRQEFPKLHRASNQSSALKKVGFP